MCILNLMTICLIRTKIWHYMRTHTKHVLKYVSKLAYCSRMTSINMVVTRKMGYVMDHKIPGYETAIDKLIIVSQ